MYYKRNDGKAWHRPGIIAGTDGKIVIVLFTCFQYMMPTSKELMTHSGQDGLPQSGKVNENLSCDKGEQTDVLVTTDDVINEDTGLHILKDPLSGTGSAHNGISINSVAPSAHDEKCATESEIFLWRCT